MYILASHLAPLIHCAVQSAGRVHLSEFLTALVSAQPADQHLQLIEFGLVPGVACSTLEGTLGCANGHLSGTLLRLGIGLAHWAGSVRAILLRSVVAILMLVLETSLLVAILTQEV